ncbi:D-cysteine desulfhydrase family protein [Streptacidiphilus pinicola]|uniref:D-cysteine desulfhydrase family protein n=1 Tax=Streptacidiphilus pinicola TaxID=2219663 RepID=A0A2X0IB48_9ACTN|nr:D-cysteine desulfhydrase family protein [Streptacidiphilus pinicola]
MRTSLGNWPTPLEAAPRLAVRLGLREGDLWIKRDDLIGLGAGGNKVRKLEYTVGAAMAAGADTLVTVGAPQSNHARLTAAAGAKLGLDVVLVFPGKPGASRSGNLTLDTLFGAQVHWAGDVDLQQLVETAQGLVDVLRRRGGRPALIPFGGSDATGARGYEQAGQELLSQLPSVDTAVVALGSGGTMAGLVAALGAERVLGVDTGAMDQPAAAVAAMAGELTTPTGPGQLRIRTDQVGPGYGRLTDSTAAALELAARTEGIALDPVYTGRAMAGLVAAVGDGTIAPGQTTVFWHTGGLAGLFGHAEAVDRFDNALTLFPT